MHRRLSDCTKVVGLKVPLEVYKNKLKSLKLVVFIIFQQVTM
jgi:hypothetical protein